MSAPARGGWGAFVLSLIFPGAGQFYAGSVKLGAGIWLASILLPLGMVSAIVVAPSVIRGIVALVVLYVLARLAVAIHAGRMFTSKRQTIGPVLIFVVATYLVGTVHGLLTRQFLVEPYKLPTDSMLPMLESGDQVFVIKAGRHSKIERGSVVVYHHGDGKDFVKRVLAVGGDTVDIVNGAVSLNLQPIPRRPCETGEAQCFVESIGSISWKMLEGKGGFGDGHWVVPEGHYFVAGDNRDNSLDSRQEGPIKAEAVKGRVEGAWIAFSDGPPWVKLERIGVRPYLEPAPQ